MKKLSLLLFAWGLLLGTPRPAAAQTVFAPLGAEWWYQCGGLTIPPISYLHARVVGDSVVGGQLAQKIRIEVIRDTGAGNHTAWTNYQFARTVGDDVWSWNTSTGAYQLEYRFGQPAGSSWSVPGCTAGSALDFMLDSVELVSVGNTRLRRQFYSWPAAATNTGISGATFLERVGSESHVLFYRLDCGPGPAESGCGLLSYADAQTRIGSPPVLGRTEARLTAQLVVSRNPSATGRFRLEGLTREPVSYEIVDARGRRISNGQLTAAAPEIDLSTKPAGLYLLCGHVRGKAFTRRLICE